MTARNTSRRVFLAGTAAVATATTAACSFDQGNGGGSGGSGGSDSGTVAINVNSFGPKPTFVNNFNPFSPTDGVVGSNYFYETLMYEDVNDEYNLKPWLAESLEFDPEARKATVKLRDDATWSDGEKITADDVVYTVMELPKQAEEQKANATQQDFTVTKIDDLTFEASWEADKFNVNGDRNLARVRVYPQHVFSKEDLASFTNTEPVSSTPLTLKQFTPQRVSFNVRDDHFMGPWEHIKELNWTPFGSAEIGKSMILQGTLDWATMSMQNAQETIVAEGNHYWTIELVGCEGIQFNCAKAPFDDKAVRHAFYAALDTDQIHSLFDIGLKSTSPTTMDAKVFGDKVLEEYREPHTQDREAAKKYLEDAGYTVEGGKLTKDGTTYDISFKTVADYVNWATWSDGIKAQLKDVLGLDVPILKIPDAQIWEQYATGEYDFGMTWIGGGPRISAVYADYHSKNFVPIGEEALGNTGRVNNPELDRLLDESAKEMDEDKLTELGYQMQKIVVEECYCAPFNPSASFLEASGANWEGFPQAPLEKGDIIPRPYGPEGWLTMQKLKPVQ